MCYIKDSIFLLIPGCTYLLPEADQVEVLITMVVQVVGKNRAIFYLSFMGNKYMKHVSNREWLSLSIKILSISSFAY